MFGPGDLRLVLLSLIAEKPRHGYDLIRAIEEKFAGAYAPSPGAVYPTLTLLEEQDYIVAGAQSGTKKLYEITDAGRGFLDENAVALRGIQSRMDLAAQAFSIHSTPETVREAIRTLKQSLHMRRGPWTPEEAERVRKLIEATARQIVGAPQN
jgi:DNA-binding PadR family transcriptional regulator